MRRVTVIVGVWLGLLLAAVAGYVQVEGDAAVARGLESYVYRESLKRQLARTSGTPPDVVWLGDSTMLGLIRPSYPQLLRGVLPDVPSRVIGFLGADFYAYYPCVGALLAVHHPAVLVLVAHLRLFRHPSDDPTGLSTTRNDLVSLIPTAELANALALPFAWRGVTIPRLLLARLLRYETVERALYLFHGARAGVADADVGWLGPNRRDDSSAGFRGLGIALAASNVSVTPQHPMVRMMEATIRLARKAGVHVIVVGTPIPYEDMRETVGYDPQVYATRFAVLRAAVEDADGIFVDAHEALARDLFTDPVGHFDAAGAAILAERIRPVVEQELGRFRWETWVANHPATPRAP